MRDLKTYKLTQDREKTQLHFADSFQLSQSNEDDKTTQFDWRDMLKSFNQSRN